MTQVETSGGRGKPLTHRMNRDDLRRQYARSGVSVPRQKSKKTRDKKGEGRNKFSSRGGKMENGQTTPYPQPGPVPNPNAQGGRTIGQVAKETGTKAAINGLIAVAVTAFGVWFNHKLNS